jgi:hypothetical protein
MEAENILFFKKKPFGVSLIAQEQDFIAENFEELFDGDTTIAPRPAFMKLAEKALYKIQANNKSLPKDLERIQQLETELNTCKTNFEELDIKHKTLSTQFNDLVQIKLSLENQLQEKPQTIEKQLAENEVILQLTPLEKWLLDQLVRIHGTNAKDLLINRFLMVYQRRGNGDFTIKRMRPEIFEKAETEFKKQ